MAEPVAIDRDGARAFLRTHLGRDPGPVELVGEGAWSRCFGYRDGGRERVIRFGRHRSDFDKDARAAGFASAALPVPAVFEVADVDGPPGGSFAISERVFGEPLEELDAAGWRALLPDLLAALDALRALPAPAGTGFGDWHEGAPHATWAAHLLAGAEDLPGRRTHGWRARLRASSVGEAPFDRCHARLAELASPIDIAPSVVHADLINRNAFVRDGRLEGVFDWGCSIQGDFLYDVAWLGFWEPWHPAIEQAGVVAAARDHVVAQGMSRSEFDARLCCCLVHIGLDHIAYCAFVGRPRDLERITERTLRFAGF